MIPEHQAKELFRPIQSDLIGVILKSWKKIHSTDLHFKSRSRACLMWDETFYLANIAWCESKHIAKIEERKCQTAHYWFDNNTLFRIKKGDRQGYTRNNPTQTSLEFHEQQSDLFGGVDKMEVTYVLNRQETDIVDVAVVYRDSGAIEWRFSLLDAANVEALPHREEETPDSTEETESTVARLKSELDSSDNTETSHEE